LIRAAVKAYDMAAAVPNMAAFHQRGPQRVATTPATITPTEIPPTTTQPLVVGTRSPPPGTAKARNPARPRTMAVTPIHSRAVIL
jgi:cell division septation protein DedD